MNLLRRKVMKCKNITITIKPKKERNIYAYELWTNGVYKPKVIQNKKAYNRKKMKKGKALLDNLSPYNLYILAC